MKLPLIKVPDFRKEVEGEEKPDFFATLSKRDKEDYVRTLVARRTMLWACNTSAAAYNLGIVILCILVLTNGFQLLQMLQKVVSKYLGIT